MDHKEKNNVLRRDVLKVGLSLFAITILAACGSSATTQVAPSPTAAPVTQATDSSASATQPSATDTSAASASTADAPSATTADISSSNTTSNGQVAVFQIDPSQTKALFSLGEVLLGKPNIVTGTTTKVTGAVSVTMDNVANTKLGTIQIDATDLHTDSGRRDGMIQRFILQANQSQFQYITFEPTAIEGLPAKASAGAAIPLKITGNLKIRDVVKPVTFDTTVTMKSDTELDGTAKATVKRADFGLQIPSVPTVANVTDDVALELQFVATKQ